MGDDYPIRMLWVCGFLGVKRQRNQPPTHRTPLVAREKSQRHLQPIYVMNAVYRFSILCPVLITPRIMPHFSVFEAGFKLDRICYAQQTGVHKNSWK